MKKLQFALLLTAAVLTVAVSGCVLTPHENHTTRNYDLAMLMADKKQDLFRVSVFENNTPSRNRMLYRQKNNQIVQDEYNRWVQTPERLLQRYFELAFPVSESADVDALGTLRCTITAFEFDWERSEAVLALNYFLRSGSGKQSSGSLIFREKAAEHTPSGFAGAMSRAANAAVGKIAQAARKLAQNN